MKLTLLKSVVCFLVLSNLAMAATERIEIREVNGDTTYRRPAGWPDVDYDAKEGNWNKNNFDDEIPLLNGTVYRLVVIGDWLDTHDRIEVTGVNGTGRINGVGVSNVRKYTYLGKGRTRFDLRVGDLPRGSRFMVRIRFGYESNTGDKLPGENIKFAVFPQTQVTRIQLSPAPIRDGNVTRLMPGVEYDVIFTFAGNLGYQMSCPFLSLDYEPFVRTLGNAPSFVFSSDASTLTLRAVFSVRENRPTRVINLLERARLDFAFYDTGIQSTQRGQMSYHVAASIASNLPNTGDSVDLRNVALGVFLPDLIPAVEDTGIQYAVDTRTRVRDRAGNSYFKLAASSPNNANATNDALSFIEAGLRAGSLNAATSNQGSDINLGDITLREILLGQYRLRVDSRGAVDVVGSFRVQVSGRMVLPQPAVLPPNGFSSRRLPFVDRSSFSLHGNMRRRSSVSILVPKANLQFYSFSNRPNEFFIREDWAPEPLVFVEVDIDNSIEELTNSNNRTSG